MTDQSIKPTIKDALESIDKNDLVLPALQREFVWNPEQIESLFDSVLDGYPIGSLTFWKYNSTDWNARERFYEYVKVLDLDKRNRGRRLKSSEIGKNTFAVIDGQQRLTSFYIGLKSKCRVEKNNNFLDYYLYLDLRKPEKIGEADEDYATKSKIKYFSFKTRDKATDENKQFQDKGEPHYLFEVKDILDLETSQIGRYLEGLHFKRHSKELDYASNRLQSLSRAIGEKNLLVDVIKEEDSMFVLDAFIRLNRRGETLSNIDFLFSVITKQWEERPGSECIDALRKGMKVINDLGFTKKHILNACLAIVGQPVNLGVESFGRKVTKKLEKDWYKIVLSLLLTVKVLKEYGFTEAKMLGPKKAILCIVATYIAEAIEPGENSLSAEQIAIFDDDDDPVYREDFVPNSFINNMKKYGKAHENLRTFVYQAALAPSDEGSFNYWGRKNDVKINRILTTIRKEKKSQGKDFPFPFEKIVEDLRDVAKFEFGEEHISELMETKKDDSLAFPLLALLFPNNHFNKPLDKDHIWPKDKMKEKDLKEAGVPDAEIRRIADEDWVDSLANLQLLPDEENRTTKNAELPAQWLGTLIEGKANAYRRDHFLDPEVNGHKCDLPEDQKGFLEWVNYRSMEIQIVLAELFGIKDFKPQDRSQTAENDDGSETD